VLSMDTASSSQMDWLNEKLTDPLIDAEEGSFVIE
jgi:hypothetical protein